MRNAWTSPIESSFAASQRSTYRSQVPALAKQRAGACTIVCAEVGEKMMTCLRVCYGATSWRTESVATWVDDDLGSSGTNQDRSPTVVYEPCTRLPNWIGLPMP